MCTPARVTSRCGSQHTPRAGGERAARAHNDAKGSEVSRVSSAVLEQGRLTFVLSCAIRTLAQRLRSRALRSRALRSRALRSRTPRSVSLIVSARPMLAVRRQHGVRQGAQQHGGEYGGEGQRE